MQFFLYMRNILFQTQVIIAIEIKVKISGTVIAAKKGVSAVFSYRYPYIKNIVMIFPKILSKRRHYYQYFQV